MTSPSAQAPLSWWQRLTRWWAEFTLQTKLLAAATLVVSLVMAAIAFFALNGIQTDVRMSDTRFARDLGLLLSAMAVEMLISGLHRAFPALAPIAAQ